jgi:hypothetical protein
MSVAELALFIVTMLGGLKSTHPVVTHHQETKIAEEVLTAATNHNIPPRRLAGWAFFESSYDATQIGTKGEVGYMQVHGQSKAFCMKHSYEPGSFECGSALLEEGTRICGSLYKASLWYASGSCDGIIPSKRKEWFANPVTAKIVPRAIRMTRYRISKIKEWEEKTDRLLESKISDYGG